MGGWVGVRGEGGERGEGGGGGGADTIAGMHLIWGARSPGSQTPGDPATPSPPQWRGSTLPCACAQGPTIN